MEVLSVLGPQWNWSYADSVHAITVCKSSNMHQTCFVWNILFSRCPLSSLTFKIFLAPLLHSSLSSEGSSLMKMPFLDLSLQKFLSLHILQLLMSLLVQIYAGGSFSNAGYVTLAHGYSRISLSVVLLLCFFSTIVFDFPLNPCPVWSHILDCLPDQCQL